MKPVRELSVLLKHPAEDDICKVAGGKVKPSKCILFGLDLKSITGSRKIHEVVNHFGYCIELSYYRRIWDNIATEIIDKKQVLPDGLKSSKGQSTNSAWDNYDESMYHDTGQLYPKWGSS